MASKEQQLKKLERVHARGILSFVVRYGVIGWGISSAAVFLLIQGFRSDDQSFLSLLGVALIVFPISGIAWGACMWWFLENRRRRLLRDSA